MPVLIAFGGHGVVEEGGSEDRRGGGAGEEEFDGVPGGFSTPPWPIIGMPLGPATS